MATRFLAMLLIVAASGCAETKNSLGHYWSYQTPPGIAAADQAACEQAAEKQTFDYFNSVPGWPLLILGPISVIGGVIWVAIKRNNLYEDAMHTCLKAKGYSD